LILFDFFVFLRKEKLVMVGEKLAARLLLPLVISVGRLRGMRRIA
jgi:hypothetical protein